LTKVEDPLSTSQAIEKLIINKELRQKLVNNAYQTVSKYTIQRMANETANFYLSKISHLP
jgi:glycosyltransferase involved in cell wall biosynthesis